MPTSAYFSKQQISIPQVTVKDAGYIFVYLSYEDQSNNYVQFDDFKITHTKGNLIQASEYYPFGMQTVNSWTRENTTGNNFLANGGTELNATSNLYDLEFRNYDPVLGRMNGVDPMASMYSSLTPYNFSFNDPVTFTDPSGADPNRPGDMDFTGSYIEAYSHGWSPGMAPMTIMDPGGGGGGGGIWNPATAGGYGVQGYMGSISSIVSNYAPDFRGYQYIAGGIYGLPSEIARAGGPEAYYNLVYNYNLGMQAFNMTPNPNVKRGVVGTIGDFPVENGDLDLENAKFYEWKEKTPDENLIASLSPGHPFKIPQRSDYPDNVFGTFWYELDKYMLQHQMPFSPAPLRVARGVQALQVLRTQWGWTGTNVWKSLVRIVRSGGTIESLSGKVPTKSEALRLIKEAGGQVERVQGPHAPPNPHVYNHINYITPSGTKGTIKILNLD